jgi:hypothetical protein
LFQLFQPIGGVAASEGGAVIAIADPPVTSSSTIDAARTARLTILFVIDAVLIGLPPPLRLLALARIFGDPRLERGIGDRVDPHTLSSRAESPPATLEFVSKHP